MDLCWWSNVSAFQYAIYVGHSFSSKEQASFNFMHQGSNPCLLPWQADSLPLSHQGSLNFPKSYKISVDQKLTMVIATNPLSPTALVFFRELSGKNVDHHHSHYLLCQISERDLYLSVTRAHGKCDAGKRCWEVVPSQESTHQGFSCLFAE